MNFGRLPALKSFESKQMTNLRERRSGAIAESESVYWQYGSFIISATKTGCKAAVLRDHGQAAEIGISRIFYANVR